MTSSLYLTRLEINFLLCISNPYKKMLMVSKGGRGSVCEKWSFFKDNFNFMQFNLQCF